MHCYNLEHTKVLEQHFKCFVMFSVLQLRAIPVKPAEDDELEEEAEWIFRHGFSTLTISMQVKSENIAWASTMRAALPLISHSVGTVMLLLICLVFLCLCSRNRRALIIWTEAQPQTSAGKVPAPSPKSKRLSTSWGINILRYTSTVKLNISNLFK